MPPHGIFLYIQERQCNGFRSRHCIVDDSKISDNLQAKGKRIFPTRFSSPHGFSFSFPSAHKFSQFCLQYELTPQPSFLSRLARPDDAVFLLGKAPNDILCKDAAGWRPAGSAVKAGEPFRKGRQPLHLSMAVPKSGSRGGAGFAWRDLIKSLDLGKFSQMRAACIASLRSSRSRSCRSMARLSRFFVPTNLLTATLGPPTQPPSQI